MSWLTREDLNLRLSGVGASWRLLTQLLFPSILLCLLRLPNFLSNKMGQGSFFINKKSLPHHKIR
ncbi:hypothetical protein ACRRTK_017939 [Alexandromys fortis]